MYLGSFEHEVNEFIRKHGDFVESTKPFLGVWKMHRFVE